MSSSILKLVGVFAMIICPFSIFGQSSGPSEMLGEEWKAINGYPSYLQQNESDSLVVWQEQILLHMDKEALLPKDHLFFKAYVLTGPNQLRVSASEVMKLELLDKKGNLVETQYHRIEGGASFGAFQIPKKTKPGEYYVRAYTRWMLNYGVENFAVKRVKIGPFRASADFNEEMEKHVEVFPEGGQLVAGLKNRVAVASDWVDLGGMTVVDSKQEVVATLKKFDATVGSFALNPEMGQSYYLMSKNGKKMRLPDIQGSGYAIQVNNIEADNAIVEIAVSPSLQGKPVTLKGEVNGITRFESDIRFDKNNTTKIEVSKAGLPNGVVTLKIEDELGQIWAQRPLHIANQELTLHVKETHNNEKESFLLKVVDSEGKPVATDISLLVKDQKHNSLFSADTESFTGQRNQRFINDLLVWTNQLPNDFPLNKHQVLPTEIKYSFQKGLEFYGQAYDLNNSLLMDQNIQVVIFKGDNTVIQEVKTNSEGLFWLENLDFEGEVDMLFRTNGEDTYTNLVRVIPFDYETPELKINYETASQPLAQNPKSKQFISKQRFENFEFKDKPERLIPLEGVTLTGDKKMKKITPSVYNIEPTRVVYQNPKRPKTIPQLFLGMPGVQVEGLGDLYPSITIIGNVGAGPVLWVVDGFPLSQAGNGGMSTIGNGTIKHSLDEILDLVNFQDVERIELLTGPDASIFGSRASGGVILIYTRSGSYAAEVAVRKDAQLKFKGFQSAVPFEELMTSKRGKRTKKSSTLYWNPNLKTDANGEVEVPFALVNSEQIILEVKAVTNDGKKGSLITTLLPQ